MSSPASNDIQKLTADEQHAIAEVELAKLRSHERLLRRARTYRGRQWISITFMGVALLALCRTGSMAQFPYYGMAFLLLATVVALIEVHAHGVNQRLDAVMKLLDSDQNAATRNDPS